MTHVFVVPDPAAMISGGNLYNASLIAALRDAGARVTARELTAGEAAHDDGPDARYWIDSLYLDALPRLRRAGRRAHLIAHYLPSLVQLGAIPTPAQLSASEQAALAAADGFLVPSPFMAGVLLQLGAAPRPVLVVAPGVVAPESPVPLRDRGAALRAIVVANVVPNKRVLPFIDALAPSLRADIRLEVTVAGSLTMDRAYSRACQERVASDPALAAAVRFVGPIAHTELLSRVAASDLLVSPSCMESFGLALAEARALGVPIVARAGGHGAAHVDPRAGGELAESDEALAQACVQLAADRDELSRRRTAARAARPAPRDWAEAARDFLAAQRAPGSE
ncbi:MAG: glycosyltransferase family 4 protein [Polyangia bacterium]